MPQEATSPLPRFDRQLRSILTQERKLVLLLIITLVLTAWGIMISMLGDMAVHGSVSDMGPGMVILDYLLPFLNPLGHIISHPAHTQATLPFVWLTFMWLAMVAGMMLPTAVPTILAYLNMTEAARDNQEKIDHTGHAGGSLFFTSGYLIVWAVAGLGGAYGQLLLHQSDYMNPAMVSRSTLLSAFILIIAGAYQFSSLKEACLTSCRSPMQFFFTHWQEGQYGALLMGLRHGLICVGCCWALMAVMYVVGVMNVLWMALLGVLMLSEKVWRHGAVLSKVCGWVFLVWGILLIFPA